jgi:hypothetical protein
MHSASSFPSGNGKIQPWKQVYPPKKEGLPGVAESKGQMLLLDGTGGSGTVAVPNSVMLPPKPQEKDKTGS